MDGIKDKIREAKKAGYSDEEIVQFLAQMPTVGAQITTAIESQYTPKEILGFLGDTKSEAYKQGTKMPTFQRALTSALGGPTLGFYEELAGAVSAPVLALKQGIPLGQAYRQGRDILRGAAESYEQESPIMAAAGQLAASGPMMLGRGIAAPLIEAVAPRVAPPVARALQYVAGAPKAGQVMGMGQRMVQAGAAGAGYGAVGGAGASTAETAQDIVADALESAAIGAGLGAVSQPAMGILGAVGRQGMARVSPTAAGTYAQQKVAEALIRDVPEQLAPSALTRAQARLARLGPEARIADVAGKSTRSLLDVQATLPGTTADAVERAIRERQATRAGRMMAAADESLGTQGAQYLAKLEDFSAQRFKESRPYYAVVDAAMVKADDKILDLLNRSKDLLGNAQTEYLRKTGKTINLSNVQRGQDLPMEVLDVLKQSLYDEAQSLKQSGKTGSASNLDAMRQNLIQTLTEKSPKIGGKSAYAQALEKWAGPSQMLDAAEVGRKVMRGDILDVQQATKGFSQSEIDAFRIGALQSLREKTGTEAGQTQLLKMWKEPATQDRLKAAFGNDYRTFAAAVAKEARLKGLESVGRGSQTAARLAGQADLDVAPLTQVAGAASSGNLPAIVTAAANLARQTQTPEAVRNEIGRILLSRDPRQLQQLEDVIRRLNESRARAASAAGFGAGQIGGMTQGFMAP